MTLWWLEPGWTDATCPQCSQNIWSTGGDPDWGLCYDCFSQRQQYEQEMREQYEEEICREYEEEEFDKPYNEEQYDHHIRTWLADLSLRNIELDEDIPF